MKLTPGRLASTGIEFINCFAPKTCANKKLLKSWAQGAKVGRKVGKLLMKSTPGLRRRHIEQDKLNFSSTVLFYLEDVKMKNSKSSTLCFTLGHGPDDVGISGVCDGEGANAEVLAAGCAQLNVVAGVVVDAGLGQHGVVLNLGLPVMQKEQVEKLQSNLKCGDSLVLINSLQDQT